MKLGSPLLEPSLPEPRRPGLLWLLPCPGSGWSPGFGSLLAAAVTQHCAHPLARTAKLRDPGAAYTNLIGEGATSGGNEQLLSAVTCS